jgi:hypothetical protein
MNILCPLSSVVRIVFWVGLIGILVGLFLGYQAGASVARPSSLAASRPSISVAFSNEARRRCVEDADSRDHRVAAHGVGCVRGLN